MILQESLMKLMASPMPDANDILNQMEAVCEAVTKGTTEWEAVKIPMPLNEKGKAKWPNKDHLEIFMVRTVEIHPQLKDREWLIRWWNSPYTEQAVYPSFSSMEDAEFHARARKGWPATIKALRAALASIEAGMVPDYCGRSVVDVVAAILEGSNP